MLTDDMTRLCGEILAMRNMRGNMMSELQRGAKGRKQAVAELCAHIGSARMAMARRTKNERLAFLSGLRRWVGAHRRDLRNDLAGARRAWAGKSA
jgi:hypothetical protein